MLVGLQAPAALVVSFVPMFFIASAFYYMNKADPDCGTSFSWVTRSIGPQSGWITGWAICVTGILVVGSLADVAAYSFFDLIGAESLQNSTVWVTATAVFLMVVMTAVCVWGTEISANLQKVLMAIQLVPLLLFVGVALWKVFAGDAPNGSIDPSFSWFNPFAIEGTGALTGALLLGVFIYWGWESAVNLNEETGGDVTKPGLAGVISTAILLVTYLGVATALVAWGGIKGAAKFDDDAAILSTYADQVLGGTLGPLVLLAIVVSALASTQTTILPASRTSMSMARAEAMPKAFGEVSSRFFTPVVSTVVDRRAGDRLVPAGQADQRELPLRFTLGPVADDRLLLRDDRLRLRLLLPPRTDQVGEELPLRRGGAGDRRPHPDLPVRQVPDRLVGPGEFVHRVVMAGLRATRDHRRRIPPPRGRPAVRLALPPVGTVLQAAA